MPGERDWRILRGTQRDAPTRRDRFPPSEQPRPLTYETRDGIRTAFALKSYSGEGVEEEENTRSMGEKGDEAAVLSVWVERGVEEENWRVVVDC